MKNKVEKAIRKIKKSIYATGAEILFTGCLTGVCVGVAVSFYNILAVTGEAFSRGVYETIRETPALIPVLLLTLFVAAIVIGTIVKLIPMIRGSGIPQTEGASRGVLRFKWYSALCGMFAVSLATIFLGLSAGSEGPSLHIGGACGNGVATVLKRNPMHRRYQITGGASAGLAVAFNAPLTGMAFAFEEAQKRFSPEVFICAFSSVVTSLFTRNAIRSLLGYHTESTFAAFRFADITDMNFYLFVILAAAVCGGVGILFYKSVFFARKVFAKITFFKGVGKMTIPFVIGGVFGLISVYAMGGGHEFIESLGSLHEGEFENVLGAGVILSLVIVVIMKFIVSVMNMGAGVPCGVFIPMLAIGAGIGAIMSQLCQMMGMDAAYSDILIMICMATFFATIVKAPITAIAMVFELTWSFTSLIPVVLGVAIGYMIGFLSRTEPIYEELLEGMVHEYRKTHPIEKEVYDLAVGKGSIADGAAVRELAWPGDVTVTTVERFGEKFNVSGGTILQAGDHVTIIALTDDRAEVEEDLCAILKPGDIT